LPKLPKFANERDAADWFAAHDTAKYMDDLERVKDKIPVRRAKLANKPVALRLREDQLKAIQQVARRKRIPFQALIRSWLLEKLRQEAPTITRGHR
jgi:predicted DNA binding CopG/RHH family protein